MDASRRSFLKFFGLGSLAVPATMALGSVSEKPKEAKSLLVKEWQEEGITFLEYLLPPSVNALFKQPGRKRAIYCPIKNIEVEKLAKVVIIGQNGGSDTIRWEKATPEILIADNIKACKMHMGSFSRWPRPHIYIVRIENHPELLGSMINKDRLEIEVDNYTVY